MLYTLRNTNRNEEGDIGVWGTSSLRYIQYIYMCSPTSRATANLTSPESSQNFSLESIRKSPKLDRNPFGALNPQKPTRYQVVEPHLGPGLIGQKQGKRGITLITQY